MKTWIQENPLISFFVLTYAIAFSSTFVFIYLAPGQPTQRWPLSWFLNAFSPTISALIISGSIGGWKEIKRLLSGFTRWKVGLGWYLAAAYLFLGPLAFAVIYIALGNQISGPQTGTTASLLVGQIVPV